MRAAARNEVRSAGGADPLQFRPNPEGLVDKVRGAVVSGANGLSFLTLVLCTYSSFLFSIQFSMANFQLYFDVVAKRALHEYLGMQSGARLWV